MNWSPLIPNEEDVDRITTGRNLFRDLRGAVPAGPTRESTTPASAEVQSRIPDIKVIERQRQHRY